MKELQLTCIRCPIGCPLEVTLEKGEVLSVEGNECRLGLEYAKKESTHPTRSLATTVPIHGGIIRQLPVKTSTEIPKANIFDFMNAIGDLQVFAPVAMGDIIAHDIGGLGADLVATRTIPKIEE